MTQLPTYENSVFINCPFDPEYLDLFHAMIFTISCLGFSPRCSLEAGYGGIRLIQIIEIIEQCKYGIHDISRVELDNATGLPKNFDLYTNPCIIAPILFRLAFCPSFGRYNKRQNGRLSRPTLKDFAVLNGSADLNLYETDTRITSLNR